MLAAGDDGLDNLAGFRVCEGERDDCGGGLDRGSQDLLDLGLAVNFSTVVKLGYTIF